MEVLYLGTGASEGIPGTFCHCDICREARLSKGRNLRSRNSMLIDGELLLDIAPDFRAQTLQHEVDASRIRYVLVTHDHSEHAFLSELHYITAPYRIAAEPVRIELYLNAETLKRYDSLLRDPRFQSMHDSITTTKVEAFKPINVGPYLVTPLPARHCKGAFIYLIEREGRVFLCGNDTGFFPEKTWDFLAGHTIHVMSLDCNNPFNSDTPNHMCIEDVVTTRRRLFHQGCIGPKTRILITHIAHNSGLNHTALQERMNLYAVTVAYDGLRLEV